MNHGTDPLVPLYRLPLAAVEEIHVAGHERVAFSTGELLLDDHGSAVADPVLRFLVAPPARTASAAARLASACGVRSGYMGGFFGAATPPARPTPAARCAPC